MTTVTFDRDYDVLVTGAGVAGVAAALETARAGLRTALVEKTVLVGGLATTGLINDYISLCDGKGHQVIFGIAEELLHRSLKYGPGRIPEGWGKNAKVKPRERYHVFFSPASFTLALGEALEEAGVALWLDSLICQPVMNGERVTGVEVETKSGRGTLRARCVVDATGDAEVAYRAGAECVEGDNWLSMVALQASLERARKALVQPDKVSLMQVLELGADAFGKHIPPGSGTFRGIDAEEITRFILDGHRLLREHYQSLYAQGGELDRYSVFPITLPAMAQLRKIRRIVGRETLSDGQHGVHFSTSIGLTGDWRTTGHIWEIPYGALLPTAVTGLVAAGRCISSAGDAWEVTRVIPPVALTGQVAGIAARLSVEQDTTPDKLLVGDIQKHLSRAGMPFHTTDVL